MNRAAELLSRVTSFDLQTRMVDTVYDQLKEQYIGQSMLFSRLVSRLIHVCEAINRVDLAESVFTRYHKHAGEVMLQQKALHAYTEMAVILCRHGQLDQAETGKSHCW